MVIAITAGITVIGIAVNSGTSEKPASSGLFYCRMISL
jgi:hypothetical protein